MNIPKRLLFSVLFPNPIEAISDISKDIKSIFAGPAIVQEQSTSTLGNFTIYKSACISSDWTEFDYLCFQENPQPDGSCTYVEANGTAHTITADRAQAFMEKTHEHATIMCGMIDRLKEAGLMGDGPVNNDWFTEELNNLLTVLHSESSIPLSLQYPFVREETNSFLALSGIPKADGSWVNINVETGTLCTIDADYAQAFMEKTHEHATIMCGMIDSRKEAGLWECGVDVISTDVYHNISQDLSPAFSPSVANKPTSLFKKTDDLSADVLACLTQPKFIQSFFSDLDITINGSSLRDEILHIQPFDESRYCKLILENHKYSLAELYDTRNEEADKRAASAFKIGIIPAVCFLNPLFPFFLSNQARINSPKGTRLEELIPDPYLLFLEDRHSFLSMTQAGTPMPRLRRLILHPVASSHSMFLRVIPSLITHDCVIPLQAFKCSGNYLLRPISAGIDPNQKNYNSIKMHRKYYHLRADGGYVDTGKRISVTGRDVDCQRFKLFKYSSDTRELEYYYIDYQTEPSHVF